GKPFRLPKRSQSKSLLSSFVIPERERSGKWLSCRHGFLRYRADRLRSRGGELVQRAACAVWAGDPWLARWVAVRAAHERTSARARGVWRSERLCCASRSARPGSPPI